MPLLEAPFSSALSSSPAAVVDSVCSTSGSAVLTGLADLVVFLFFAGGIFSKERSPSVVYVQDH